MIEREVLAYESADHDFIGFDVGFVDTVVSDVGIGGDHNLAVVRWIGEDFLVTGHPGVEGYFAECCS